MKRMIVAVVLASMVVAAAGAGVVGGAFYGKATVCAQEKLLRHVVMFRFKQGTTPEQIKSVEDAFRALPGKIPQIAGFEWGTDISPEKLADGFTHCFFLTFKSEEDRNAYLPHPEHKAFGKVLGPYLDKVIVVDYWTKS